MTDQTTTATTPAHSRQAIVHLARAMGGLTTTIRAVGAGRELEAPRTLEPLGWTKDALADFDRLSKASREAADGDEGGSVDLPGALVSRLAHVAETVSQAIEGLAAGAGIAEALRYAIMADAHLTQFVRMIPEDEYAGAIRDVWGREAMPVRLR
ncbi:hypothetical protein EN817_22450 [Mesorhizobium sp. M3A.F.Ca.ET.174.01.1.1]|uniref:hypothetical protein n=1 Tax=unclassified Mesorhizobium TaxID=325217 RepID=UPI001093E979|nr:MULTISPECIES: hypothetical protein [unclassified Mesorhizobium]TGS84871.1 hypothetical protein EN818_22660 [Mesorhizobium sp. M3A.F.Ca.ET.175.01.1.1]TGT23275.1 hypothetical protein EN817_22450 [Mesorhizobium sp. M3A.F.Ca.ET.174.01.1.1]